MQVSYDIQHAIINMRNGNLGRVYLLEIEYELHDQQGQRAEAVSDVHNDLIAIFQIRSQPQDDVDILLDLRLVDAVTDGEDLRAFADGSFNILFVWQDFYRRVHVGFLTPFTKFRPHIIIRMVAERPINFLPHGARCANEEELIRLDKLLKGISHEGCLYLLIAQLIQSLAIVSLCSAIGQECPRPDE